MNKIPTLFKRDFEGSNGRYLLPEVTPGCEWVLDGEGVPTRKFDGTCVMFDGERWWARRELKDGYGLTPSGWVFVAHDDERVVLVDGWRVPFLTAIPMNGGKIDLSLDNRYALVLDVATAEEVVPFLADAIAIAKGYTCHPRKDWDGPIKREYSRCHNIALVEETP